MADREDRPRGTWTNPAVWALFLVLYLASPGPLVALASRGIISQNTFEAIFASVYAPLDFIDAKTSFFRNHPVGLAYVAYLELFDQ